MKYYTLDLEAQSLSLSNQWCPNDTITWKHLETPGISQHDEEPSSCSAP